MSKTPYSHEPSWFAAIRHISGKGGGYIIREPYIENEAPSAYVYMDGVTDGMTGRDIVEFVSKAAPLVSIDGVFIASVLKIHTDIVREQIAQYDFFPIEISQVADRDFLVFSRHNIPKLIPEVIVYRGGGPLVMLTTRLPLPPNILSLVLRWLLWLRTM